VFGVFCGSRFLEEPEQIMSQKFVSFNSSFVIWRGVSPLPSRKIPDFARTVGQSMAKTFIYFRGLFAINVGDCLAD